MQEVLRRFKKYCSRLVLRAEGDVGLVSCERDGMLIKSRHLLQSAAVKAAGNT